MIFFSFTEYISVGRYLFFVIRFGMAHVKVDNIVPLFPSRSLHVSPLDPQFPCGCSPSLALDNPYTMFCTKIKNFLGWARLLTNR